MANFSNTGTIFDVQQNTANVSQGQTRTGLSTQIVVMVNRESCWRNTKLWTNSAKIYQTYNRGWYRWVIEIVPSSATSNKFINTKNNVRWIIFTEAFSRAFVNIAAQRIPFDIVVIDRANAKDLSISIGKATRKNNGI